MVIQFFAMCEYRFERCLAIAFTGWGFNVCNYRFHQPLEAPALLYADEESILLATRHLGATRGLKTRGCATVACAWTDQALR